MGPILSTIVAVVAVVAIVGGALAYIIKAKKSGKKCIGCPDSGECSHNCSGCGCGCGAQDNSKEK